MTQTWGFRGVLLRVVDGDTYDLRLDLGFRASIEVRVRVRNIDTPELHSRDAEERARAVAATKAAEQYLAGQALWVVTYKDQTFGRWVADVYIEPERVSVAALLRANGHTV